jgi:hypothetical protein
MYVWTKQPFFHAVAQALSVAEARDLLLEEIGGGDGSCPEREAAAKWVRKMQPTIFHRSNAEFSLTDSAELREQEAYVETLQAKIKSLESAASLPVDRGAAQQASQHQLSHNEELEEVRRQNEEYKLENEELRRCVKDMQAETVDRGAAQPDDPVRRDREGWEAGRDAAATRLQEDIESWVDEGNNNDITLQECSFIKRRIAQIRTHIAQIRELKYASLRDVSAEVNEASEKRRTDMPAPLTPYHGGENG